MKTGLEKVTVDVAEMKTAQEAMKTAQEAMKTALEAMKNGQEEMKLILSTVFKD
jgi:uncharacterized membrane protein (DUF106 family)